MYASDNKNHMMMWVLELRNESSNRYETYRRYFDDVKKSIEFKESIYQFANRLVAVNNKIRSHFFKKKYPIDYRNHLEVV